VNVQEGLILLYVNEKSSIYGRGQYNENHVQNGGIILILNSILRLKTQEK
jgi:hypothetical protein